MLLPLDAAACRDRARAGGKGSGLARLHSHGLPVPPAVVVPTEAFRAWLRGNDLWEAARAEPGPALAARIRDGRLDAEFAGELRAAAGRLGPLLAVRSSAVDEDAGQSSFAGQYETLLGVTPGDDTERAVLACWASYYGERASAYRAGLPPEPGGMAVVVQALVQPRSAGVMFTVNPHTGSWREMTIEAAWGLGDAVVAGRIVPDFYRVQRPRRTPRPIQRVLARVRLRTDEEQVREQPEKWVAHAGGTRPEPVTGSRVGAPKLHRDDLLRLCRLGLRIEGLLGGPQDVEWALDESGEFRILQSRPVTGGAVRRSGPVVWTRRFVGERWTEPATPLGWSIIQDLLHPFIAYPDTGRRYLGGEAPSLLYRFAPYFNVTVFRHLAFKLPGMPPPRFMVELLPPEEEIGWLRRHAHPPDFRVYGSILDETFREKRWRQFRWNPFTNWRAWDETEARLDREMPSLLSPVGSRDDAIRTASRCRELAREYVGVHLCSLLFANLWYQLAEGALAGAGLDPGHYLRADGETWTERTNRALAALGRGEIALDDFLAEYGHRASSSWELASPRWREAPERALALARAARIPSGRAPARSSEAGQLADVPAKSRWMVRLARRYLRLREDQRFHFDRLLWAWKQPYLWFAHELDLDVWHLESAELERAMAGTLGREEAAAIAARRAEAREVEIERRARGDEPPSFLVGEEAVEEPIGGSRLQGLGISPGVATGPARVLRSLDESDRLNAGDILVARATDPGWTPLFLSAGGLVLELGGMLSHGAVVAREYGLPGVVNVAGATSRIADGHVVTVDGTRGAVWVR